MHEIEVKTIDGDSKRLDDYAGKALLIVNVASKCGQTPQYEGLQKLHDTYAPKGFSVLGFPCNQFGNQDPGAEDDIKEFCTLNYGVNFPMFAKLDVNGEGRHPLYSELAEFEDADGKAGDVLWNFEKFLISPDGKVVGRFRPLVRPEDPALIEAVEAQLPK